MMRTKIHKLILFAILFGAAGLIIMHIITMYRTHSLGVQSIIVVGGFDFNFAYWFNIDTERRFGAIFSTLLILFASGTMLAAAIRFLPKKVMVIGWLFLSGVLFFMACDEFFMIHERTGEFFGSSDHFGDTVIPGWVKAMGVIVALLCIPMGLFWWKLPTYLKIRTAIAAGVFLGGAMGGEILGMTHANESGIENFRYGLLTALEEGLEMLGMIIAVDAMLLYHSRMKGDKASKQALKPAEPATA